MAPKRRLTIRKQDFLPICFLLFGIGYYITNILFPFNENQEIQSPYRIIPQTICGIWACTCIVLAALNFKSLLSKKNTGLYLIFACLTLLYCLYPYGKLVQNIIYVLKTHFSVFYLLALTGLLRTNFRKMSKVVFYIFSFQILYGFISLVMDKAIFILGLSILEQFDSNSGFILASCIPLSLLLPKKRMRVYVYLFLALASIYSGQRSAALAVLLSFPFCAIYLSKYISKRDLLVIIVIGALLIPLFVSSVNNILERNMIDADKDTIGSGRSVFWKIVWDSFWNGSLLNILFGNGTNSVVAVIENGYGLAIGAHNGWLDMLYTFGITGTVLYGIIIFSLMACAVKYRKRNKKAALLYAVTFIILFTKCTTSHGYFGLNEIPIFSTVALMDYYRMVNHNRNRHENTSFGNMQLC